MGNGAPKARTRINGTPTIFSRRTQTRVSRERRVTSHCKKAHRTNLRPSHSREPRLAHHLVHGRWVHPCSASGPPLQEGHGKRLSCTARQYRLPTWCVGGPYTTSQQLRSRLRLRLGQRIQGNRRFCVRTVRPPLQPRRPIGRVSPSATTSSPCLGPARWKKPFLQLHGTLVLLPLPETTSPQNSCF